MTISPVVLTDGTAQALDSWKRFIAARINYNTRLAAETPFAGERADALSEVARYRDLANRSEYPT